MEYPASAEEILDFLEQHAGGGTEFDFRPFAPSTETTVPNQTLCRRCTCQGKSQDHCDAPQVCRHHRVGRYQQYGAR